MSWSDWGVSQMIPNRLRLPLIVLSAGAGVIHMAVIGPHFEESVLAGLFFVVIAAFQVGWSGLFLGRSDRRVLGAGLIVNPLVVAVWVWSRTAGIPFGQGESDPEAVGLADLVATGLEVLLVVGAAMAMAHGGGVSRLPRVVSLGVAALAMLVTAFAVFGGFGYPAAYAHHDEASAAAGGEHHDTGSESGSSPNSPEEGAIEP